MSDLRTELFTKVLPKMKQLTELNNLTFDDPEQPETPSKLSNNERIFNWVKANPACYAVDVAKAFDGDIQNSSVISQIYTLSERKLLHKTKCSTTGRFMYSAAADAYPVNTRANATAKMLAARDKLGKEEIARRIKEGHKASKQAEAEKQLEPTKRKVVLIKRRVAPPEPTAAVTPVDLNTLSIVQARKLYDELKQIFGG